MYYILLTNDVKDWGKIIFIYLIKYIYYIFSWFYLQIIGNKDVDVKCVPIKQNRVTICQLTNKQYKSLKKYFYFEVK